MKRSTRRALQVQARAQTNAIETAERWKTVRHFFTSLAQASSAEPTIVSVGAVLLGTTVKVGAALVDDRVVNGDFRNRDIKDALKLGGNALFAVAAVNEGGSLIVDVANAMRGQQRVPVNFNVTDSPNSVSTSISSTNTGTGQVGTALSAGLLGAGAGALASRLAASGFAAGSTVSAGALAAAGFTGAEIAAIASAGILLVVFGTTGGGQTATGAPTSLPPGGTPPPNTWTLVDPATGQTMVFYTQEAYDAARAELARRADPANVVAYTVQNVSTGAITAVTSQAGLNILFSEPGSLYRRRGDHQGKPFYVREMLNGRPT